MAVSILSVRLSNLIFGFEMMHNIYVLESISSWI